MPLRQVFPRDYIIECTEQSLRNLGVETIDLQQLHVWHDNWTDEDEWIDALLKLREQGKDPREAAQVRSAPRPSKKAPVARAAARAPASKAVVKAAKPSAKAVPRASAKPKSKPRKKQHAAKK